MATTGEAADCSDTATIQLDWWNGRILVLLAYYDGSFWCLERNWAGLSRESRYSDVPVIEMKLRKKRYRRSGGRKNRSILFSIRTRSTHSKRKVVMARTCMRSAFSSACAFPLPFFITSCCVSFIHSSLFPSIQPTPDAFSSVSTSSTNEYEIFVVTLLRCDVVNAGVIFAQTKDNPEGPISVRTWW